MTKLKIATFLVVISLGSSLIADEGSDLYKKCASCHGVSGEKAALGKSKIIKDMSVDEIVSSLNGYKDGSYGGAQKALMKGQVATLSDAQIKSIASFIKK